MSNTKLTTKKKAKKLQQDRERSERRFAKYEEANLAMSEERRRLYSGSTFWASTTIGDLFCRVLGGSGKSKQIAAK